MDCERGKIRNRTYAQQIRDFSGLLLPGGITPTDIDGFIEWHDKVMIFIEAKHGAAPLPYGQRLALERLCDACAKTHDSWVLVATHNTQEDIDFASLPLREYRWKGAWRPAKSGTLLRTAICKILHLPESGSSRRPAPTLPCGGSA